jgi:hypothetical protein
MLMPPLARLHTALQTRSDIETFSCRVRPSSLISNLVPVDNKKNYFLTLLSSLRQSGKGNPAAELMLLNGIIETA